MIVRAAKKLKRDGLERFLYSVYQRIEWFPIPKRIRRRFAELYELDFWRNVLTGKSKYSDGFFAYRLDFNRPLAEGPVKEVLMELDHGGLKMLDVGSGPITTLCQGGLKGSPTICACDPLAAKYRELLNELGIDHPVKPRTCSAERLCRQYGEEAFHFIYCRNALDHSEDPVAGIKEMMKICKKGGAILIEGKINEAISENWKGMHQWNFSVLEGEFIIQGRDHKTVKVSNIVGDEFHLSAKTHDEWMVVRIDRK